MRIATPPLPGRRAIGRDCSAAHVDGDCARRGLATRAARIGRLLVLAASCGLLSVSPVRAGVTDDGAALEAGGATLVLTSPQFDALAYLPVRVPTLHARASVLAGAADDAWRDAPAQSPDWRGASRDTWYFLSYQVVGVGVLYLAPESLTGWTDEAKENYDFARWRENVSNPVWDKDEWYVNLISHPYWGSAYYIRARERGLNPTQAFWYSAMLSAMWEYGVEALVEPVSIQDLIVTPVVGALLGHHLVTPWRKAILARPGPLRWSDRVALVLTDPLGAINETIDGWFGVKTRLQLQHGSQRPPTLLADAQGASPTAAVPGRPSGWRLTLRFEW